MSSKPVLGDYRDASGRPRGLASGPNLILRPLLEEDLPRLAQLMSEYEPAPSREPVTPQLLKKRFADDKSPGFWSDEAKLYGAVDGEGRLLGYVREVTMEYLRSIRVTYHIADKAPQREALGRELAALHMKLLKDWQRPWRVSSMLLAGDSLRAGWLASEGFVLDCTSQRSYWHMGRAVGLEYWVWFSPELLAMPRWSEGEPDYSRRGEAAGE